MGSWQLNGSDNASMGRAGSLLLTGGWDRQSWLGAVLIHEKQLAMLKKKDLA